MKLIREHKGKILSAAAVLSLLFFSSNNAPANANVGATDYPAKEHESVYLYGALENRSSIDEMLENKNIALLLEEDESLEKSLPASVRINSSYYNDRRSELLDPQEFELALKELTEKQNSTLKNAEEAMSSVRGDIGAVLLGNNLGTLEFQLVQIKGLHSLLNSLIPKTTDVGIKMQIREQMAVLKEEQQKIEDVIREKEDRFSLLGWLVATI